MMYIEGMIVSDSPTKRKSRKAVRKIVNVVRDTTRCFCSGRGTLSPQISSVVTIFVCRGIGSVRGARQARDNKLGLQYIRVGSRCLAPPNGLDNFSRHRRSAGE